MWRIMHLFMRREECWWELKRHWAFRCMRDLQLHQVSILLKNVWRFPAVQEEWDRLQPAEWNKYIVYTLDQMPQRIAF